ncbi:MAG TPA: PKD domain-containing protein, partial [Methylomirabilota bacterium]|nr:PKD domain-containing protein [Methylomirabilota bacterium]
RGNRWHHNQDSGEQFSPGAADNVSLQNRSWANGDHGYDHNQATGTLHVNDVAYGNLKDGFSVEGSSTGTHLFNCIAIENGVTTNEFDLWVDEASTAGLLSNDNVLWNSGPQPPVKVGTSVYPSVSAYATGRNQDTRSVQSNPMFVNAANGDFHLAPGSPAIDNANSSAADWSSTDAEGNARRDDPGMPNRGLGPVTFADRGALEFLGSTPVVPPVARLTATPASGTAPLAVQLDASASTAAAGRTLVSYRFEYGDGGTSGPQPAATASHTYAAGAWTATVTVTDDLGITATASTAVTVNAAPANLSPVARLTANPATGSAALRVHLSANGSSDPDGAIVSYRFDFGDGTTAGPQSSSQADHTYAAGTWTATVTATDNRGATGTATAGVVVTAAALNLPPLAQLTITPRSGVAPLSVRARGQQSVDPDGKIRSYLFDFGDSTGAEPQKSPEARHTYGAGHWTARLDVTDDRGATSSAFVTVDVSGAPANLAANGEFETGTTGWAAAGGSSISRAPGGQSGGFSLLASAPVLGLAAFGVTNLPDPVQNIAAVGTQYHVRAWVRAESGAGLVNLTMNESDASGASFTSRSSAIVLGTDWLALDLDVTTQLAVSALDLSVVEAPSVVGSAFRVDNVSIVQGTGAPAPVSALTFAEDAAEPAPADVRSLVPGVHPNPMRADGTRIVFTTDAAGPAEVAIFDLAGRLVRRLAGAGYPTKSGPAVARTQFVVFDGRGDDGRRLPGGVYYYQVRAPGTGTRGRLVLIE